MLELEEICVPQKYRLYLKRMSGLHPGANGRKGGGKGGSLPHDANFQVLICPDLQLLPQTLRTGKGGRAGTFSHAHSSER